MQPPAEHLIQRQACCAADALEPLTARADHDRLLALAVDPDRRIHREHTLLLRESFHFHRNAVGHLLVELECEFLTNGLGDPEALTAVAQLALRKERRPG